MWIPFVLVGRVSLGSLSLSWLGGHRECDPSSEVPSLGPDVISVL
jgi:hypothetical protein